MGFRLVFSKNALKDVQKIEKSGFKDRTSRLLKIIKEDPFRNPPPYEKLVGDLNGLYFRRINIQHRLVYEVLQDEEAPVVKILSMWSHYE